MVVAVDVKRCVRCAACATVAPATFAMSRKGVQITQLTTASLALRAAVEVCPMRAITVS